MKKILFVVENMGIGGVEKSLVDWLNYLSNIQDYKIDLLILGNVDTLKKDINKRVCILNVENRYQNKFKPIKAEISNLNFNLQKLGTLFVDIIKSSGIMIKEKLNIGDSIRYYYVNKVPEITDEYDIAIGYTDGVPLEYVAKKVRALKKITFIHGDYLNTKRIQRKSKIFNNINDIICVSKMAESNFIQKYPEQSSKVCRIKNLIDVESIQKRSMEPIDFFDSNYVNILSVGRLCKEKDYGNLIKIFIENYGRFRCKCRLYIIGDGDERKKLEAIINNSKLNNEIFLIGRKTNPYKYMKNCDIYVQSSISEGFGLTILEAFILKKPVLTTNVGGVSEYIIDDFNGMIAKDYMELGDKIVKMVNNKDMVEQMANNIDIKSEINNDSIRLFRKIIDG